MPERPLPPAPSEQHQLRRHLDAAVQEWGVTYWHEDRNWTSANGREVVCGWGTYIDRGSQRVPIKVWFDGLDHDIAIYGDHRRKDEYAEWQDLTVMATVLDEVINVLDRMRQPVR